MKIILDTNVIIAAFATQGLCQSVFELCLEKHILLISNELLNEVKENLRKKLKLPEKLSAEIYKYIKNNSMPGESNIQIDSGCRDPDDFHILALAVKMKADYIVSGDKDLLELSTIQKTKIVSPRDFWKMERRLSR
jgi:putative PIN family toxin of toxin-antitoxin system